MDSGARIIQKQKSPWKIVLLIFRLLIFGKLFTGINLRLACYLYIMYFRNVIITGYIFEMF